MAEERPTLADCFWALMILASLESLRTLEGWASGFSDKELQELVEDFEPTAVVPFHHSCTGGLPWKLPRMAA